MTDKIKLPLAQAQALAEKIVEALSPACERIEIAGSIRRRKPMVGDIEIVAIPRFGPKPGAMADLFTGKIEQESLLDRLLAELVERKPHFHRGGKDGEKYKTFAIDLPGGDQVKLDLFLATVEQWGFTLLIRTGPADFSKHMVTQAWQDGPLPAEYRVSGGWMWQGSEQVPIREGREWFELCGYEYREPWERDGWREWKGESTT